MDTGSQGAVAILGALSEAANRLDEFGYRLAVEHHAPGRTPARTISTTGSPFQIGRERFDRAVVMGCSIQQDATRDRSIIFSLILAWTREEWFVQACVEEENLSRDNSTLRLADPNEFRASTVAEVINLLQRAVDDLEQAAALPAVATRLAAIGKSRNV
jgi:hypothetical protein